MGQFYTDETREADPHAMPDAESFYVSPLDAAYNLDAFFLLENLDHDDRAITEPGWYWWSRFPDCLPESDAWGPWPTEAAAIKDARGSLP